MQLPKYTKIDFSQPREALTPTEAQDQIVQKLLDFSILSVQLLTLRSGGTVIKSTNSYKDVSLYPIVAQETSVGSNGPYTSKVIYEDAYYRIDVDYAENGSEIKRIETKLD
ncbi:hypothetical protein [Deinococcus alpinitundrae]|uniref:hypothetical protein n=1 Tax=Deinococcus alpinitundrae TaxID=468913 RepID=UPI00137A5745|nr:hypothetical protein [Deinococcus alpinitundrae]